MSGPPSADDDDVTLVQIYRQASREDAHGQLTDATRAAILTQAQQARTTHGSARRRWQLPVWTAAAAAVVAVLIAVPQIRQLVPQPVAPAPPPETTESSAARAASADTDVSAASTPMPSPGVPAAASPTAGAVVAKPQSRAPASAAAANTLQEVVVTAEEKRARDRAELQAAQAASAQRATSADQPPGAAVSAGSDDGSALLRANRSANALASAPSSTLMARDALGRTPLIEATVQGQLRRLQTLLAQGADPNQPDADGRTPLQWARALHRDSIADALRAAGARD